MRRYLKLMRVKHYIKNILIFFPIIFSGQIMVPAVLVEGIILFLGFSALSSTVYIMNDIKDVDKDRLHPEKCKRPIASGEISAKKGKCIAFFCVIAAICCQLFVGMANGIGWLILGGYFLINFLYSVVGWKNIPLVDVCILTAGFVLRVFYGAVNLGIIISPWLYLVIFTGALFMGFGKRRNELLQCGNETRAVLAMYSGDFLDKSMNSCMTLSIAFYTLWCMEKDADINGFLLLSVPVLVFVLLKYSLDTETNSDGDPVNVILGDKILILLVVLLGCILMWNLYF